MLNVGKCLGAIGKRTHIVVPPSHKIGDNMAHSAAWVDQYNLHKDLAGSLSVIALLLSDPYESAVPTI